MYNTCACAYAYVMMFYCVIFIYIVIVLSIVNWGEPELAPHRLVVDVGGTSVACQTIYATYTVVGWWYERHMLDNLRYIHGVWLVVRPMILLDEQPGS